MTRTKMLVNHSRKGKFVALVPNLDTADEWVEIEIVIGEAEYMADDNAVKGDVIRVRKSFCGFTPITDGS